MRQALTILSALTVLLMAAGASADDLMFETHGHWKTLPDPAGVCIADFNGDGKNDLATTSYVTDSLQIFLGIGYGTFMAAANYSSLSSPYDLFAADIDNDSDIDMVVMGNSSIATLDNNGDGSFQAPVSVPYTHYIGSIHLADLDNDGYVDLIVANSEFGYDNLIVMLNQGDGTFGSEVTYFIGGSQYGVTAVDFDGDNYLDLAVARYMVDSVAILLNDGAGDFGSAVNFAAGDGPDEIWAAEFTGDSYVDLAILNHLADNIAILAGDGSGGFTQSGSFAVQTSAADLAAGDLNGDGSLDLVVTGDSVEVLFNDGSGSFGSPAGYWIGYESDFLAVGMLDDDAYLDVAATVDGYDYYDPCAIAILINKGDGSMMTARKYDVVDQNQGICTTDYDNDGDPDLAITSWWLTSTNDTLMILENDGTGEFTVDPVKYVLGEKAFAVTAADLTGDNVDDLIVGYSDSNYISVLINNGSGSFAAAVNYTAQNRPQSMFVGDFNEDGHNDIAAANRLSGSVSIFINNGNGTFASAVSIFIAGALYSIYGADFFNNDGHIDLVVPDYANDQVKILTGDGTGAFPDTDVFSVGDGPYYVTADDLDNDGDVDVVVSNTDSSYITVLENFDGTDFTNTYEYMVVGEPSRVFIADFNNDSLPDIAEINPYLNNLGVLINLGSLNFAEARFFGTGMDPEDMCPGDFDGDDDIDIAVNNYGDYNLSIVDNRADIVAGIDDPDRDRLVPVDFILSQNYPNPFNASTVINYNVPSRGHVTIVIYNLLGQKINTIVDEWKSPGRHTVRWDGTDSGGNGVASGLYFYQIRIGDRVESKKAILLK